MDRSRQRGRRVIVGLAAVLAMVAAAAVAHDQVRRPRLTPELRGYALAHKVGCFSCHGPDGTGGIENPGSDEKEVPAWDGGTSMMYDENAGELREWILYGHPKRLELEQEHHTGDDDSEEERSNPLLDMPAFEDLISSRDLDDLVAYYKAVAEYRDVPEGAAAGYEVAARSGCFGCHGPGGLVGGNNLGSFKGYIPPWRGADYRELVKNEAELRQWILEGKIDRLASNPIAKWFIDRQVIQMPAYDGRLTDDEVNDVMKYIDWLQSDPH